jgi:hypothetical protein
MLGHRLFDLLRTFSRKEMTRWKELALSPYFHKHEDTRQLVLYLNDCYPAFSGRQCSREAIWAALFPGTPHDQGKLAVLFTYAQRLAEEFLVLEQLGQEPAARDRWLLQQYRERQVWISYEKTLRYSQRRLAGAQRRDTLFYQQQLALSEESNQYFLRREQRQADHSLAEKQQALDHFYLLEKLRDAVEMLIRQQILRSDYSARLLEAVLQELEQFPEEIRLVPVDPGNAKILEVIVDGRRLPGTKMGFVLLKDGQRFLVPGQRRPAHHQV